MFFFFKQKTAYEWRISDWSSDVCSSDLGEAQAGGRAGQDAEQPGAGGGGGGEGADGTDDHHALEAEVEDAGLLHHQLAERGEEQRRRGTDEGQQDRSKDVEAHPHVLIGLLSLWTPYSPASPWGRDAGAGA